MLLAHYQTNTLKKDDKLSYIKLKDDQARAETNTRSRLAEQPLKLTDNKLVKLNTVYFVSVKDLTLITSRR
jgi:hypothetical protein